MLRIKQLLMQNQCLNWSQIIKQWRKLIVAVLGVLLVWIGFLIYQLPQVQDLTPIEHALPTYIYTREGELIAEFGHKRHESVKIDEVPDLLMQALIVTEDRRFFEHPGVDLKGLARAAVELLTTGRKSQGGSTITMQMVRNYYLTREKTFLRKIKEIFLAFKVERHFTKKEILELYLNKIYMGHQVFGVGAAARFYFQKSLNELTTSEMALLAGMPKAPAVLNPITNKVATKKRRDFVLSRLHASGYITDAAYEQSLFERVTNIDSQNTILSLEALYFADWVRETLKQQFPNNQNGYHVYTTLEGRSQRLSEQAVFESVIAYDQRHGYRGPEKRLGAFMPQDIPRLLQYIKRFSTINRLQAALVIAVRGDYVTALLPSGQSLILYSSEWKWVVKRKKASIQQWIRQGDVIRVYQTQDGWRLGQIPEVQTALVALNPHTGAVKALSGGFSYLLSQFNRATHAERQMGSVVKPFVYAAAFEKGYNLSDVFNDAPLVFSVSEEHMPWRPQNVTRSFHGVTRLRAALVTSVNLATIRLLETIGIPYVLETMKQIGFSTSKWPKNLSLALGSAEATPLQLAEGYAVFANEGYSVTPYVINHITDYQGRLVYETSVPPLDSTEKTLVSSETIKQANPRQKTISPIFSKASTFLVTSALKDVLPYNGEHILKRLGRIDLAGKTGTTNDTIDAWFIGYHMDLVTSVWMGHDQRKPLKEYAYTTALPLWVQFMQPMLQGIPSKNPEKPDEVVILPINPESGLPVQKGSANTINEYFQRHTVDRYHKRSKAYEASKHFSSPVPLF